MPLRRRRLGRLWTQRQAARARRHHGQRLEPGPVERYRPCVVESELQRRRRVHPENPSTTAQFWVGNPGELESLVPTQFRDYDVLQMSERSIVDLDTALSWSVHECAHGLNVAGVVNYDCHIANGLTEY